MPGAQRRVWAVAVLTLAFGVGLAIHGYAVNALGEFRGGSLLTAAALVALSGLASPSGNCDSLIIGGSCRVDL